MKWCLGDVIAAGDAWTTAGLAHQLANRMEKVDVVVGEVVDPLERGRRWPLQSVVANQPATTAQFLLLGTMDAAHGQADLQFFGALAACERIGRLPRCLRPDSREGGQRTSRVRTVGRWRPYSGEVE